MLTLCNKFPVKVFQNRKVLSMVPPPLASRPSVTCDHPIALTAAMCCVKLWRGRETLAWLHTHRLLSFPPDANCMWLGDHLSPQTSWAWNWIRVALVSKFDALRLLDLRSCMAIVRSRDPVAILVPRHEITPIRSLCNFVMLIFLNFWISQRCTLPYLRSIKKYYKDFFKLNFFY